MNELIRIVSAILMISSFTALKSQSLFVKGKIILMKDDTMRGYIYTPSFQSQKQKIVFKKTLTGKSSTILKKQIKSLTSPFANYDSYEFLNQRLVTLDQLTDKQRDTVIKFSDTLFLELIVGGSINLYQLNPTKEPDRFFVSYHGILKELIGHKLNSLGYKSSDEYKLLLAEYSNDCKKKNYNTKRINFKEKDLVEFVQYENECIGKVSFIKNLKTKWRCQALAGVTSSLMRYKFLTDPNWRDLNWRSANYPTIGIAVTPMQYNKPNRFLLMMEALIQHQNTTTDIRFVENFNNGKGEVHLETFNLKLNLLGQAYLMNQNIKVYVLGGISNSFPMVIPANNFRIEATDLFGKPFIKNEIAITNDDLLGYDAYIVLGGGIEFQKFSLEYRVDYSDGLSKNLNLLSNYRNRYLMLKYRL